MSANAYNRRDGDPDQVLLIPLEDQHGSLQKRGIWRVTKRMSFENHAVRRDLARRSIFDKRRKGERQNPFSFFLLFLLSPHLPFLPFFSMELVSALPITSFMIPGRSFFSGRFTFIYLTTFDLFFPSFFTPFLAAPQNTRLYDYLSKNL